MLNDLSWLVFVMVFPGYVLQLSCIAIASFMDRSRAHPQLYGDGRAAERIVEALEALDERHGMTQPIEDHGQLPTPGPIASSARTHSEATAQ